MKKSGSSSASKGTKTGGSAAGKTINTSSTRGGSGGGGGGGFGNRISTVTDPKTGQTYARPSYGGFTLKGLTSSDPANVARNREGSARSAAIAAARAPRSDSAESGKNGISTFGKKATPAPVTAPAAPSTMYVPAPAGYRPGVDPEHRFYQPKPTVTLAKGGKVKPKRKK